jgi:hypothetical protein
MVQTILGKKQDSISFRASWAGGLTQVGESLPSKCETLSSNPSTAKRKKEKRKSTRKKERKKETNRALHTKKQQQQPTLDKKKKHIRISSPIHTVSLIL